MDAATIEETNRLRVSLGLKPLPVPGQAPKPAEARGSDSEEDPASTVETRQAQAYENYQKAMEAEAAKKRREEKAAAVRKAREQAQRFAKLEGEGLAEGKGDADLDTKAWLMGQKKRQKKIDKARKLEEELAAAEAQAAAAIEYTSKDLAGINVAHDTSAFLDGDDQILTLKDTTIDANEEEGDVLENINLREQENLKDRLDLKKKRPGYNPNDDDDVNQGILAQYDEEINGKKTKKFTLGGDGSFGELADILDQPADKTQKPQNLSLDDIVGDAPISSDYLAPSEIKIKKPKKKKNKGTRKKQVDEDDIFPAGTAVTDNSAMDIDTKEPAPTRKRIVDDHDFVDDEDLQASLALQRKNALKKRKKTRPEDIVQQLKEQDDDPAPGESGGVDGGLVIGEVSEFVSGLSKPDEDEEERARKRRKATTKTPEALEPQEDHRMKDADHDEGVPVKQESPEPEAVPDEPVVDEEKTVGTGMGAALSLLRERGLVSDSHGEEEYKALRDREYFMAEKKRLEAELDEQTRQQRERDRRSGRLDKMSTREREEYARQQNQWRDQQQAKRMAELFAKTYKPNVKLKYTDDHGRDLNQKEAFKYMSHQFHGKGSGKGKTEKRLKQIEDEKRREAQSMFDATQNGGMSSATAQQLKKRREAGVRLG